MVHGARTIDNVALDVLILGRKASRLLFDKELVDINLFVKTLHLLQNDVLDTEVEWSDLTSHEEYFLTQEDLILVATVELGCFLGQANGL